ncbi:acetyl-CoA carboxyl transferase [Pediococcus ethanolidurans]|uniref:acetyl-CoA carboxylase carboxyltransferase subunit beta n=1 Tax=Pediococcus ethanolidurans TaxID=319653 RepID=UPI001C1E8E16|nr:acetyl-CoA carboxylase carboxyltransferase subunit beta [Pediococcus ethanolidurans]MBU7554393.1 acetyl-CoA carboxyl transferase [Pediococcus ethanolidurans]MBU7563021.1 acetyl-CoA carboxyl transferase [Pediococcus ethanolidurans]MCT4398478.1 acetyl-CoA carboxyl transferase [Pediococcus ethanolidurans]MCV3315191.1 acetyl-CoA carboxyl transferase [Pediococcus ethanolidurans]MCV3321259.1 acetyl-CoA carboxyl transferase [Pediococcus ethanolidurans]
MSHLPEKNSWQICQHCGKHVHDLQWAPYFRCPFCQNLQRLSNEQRLKVTVDTDSWHEIRLNAQTTNFLDFPNYSAKLHEAQNKTHHGEAIQIGTAKINTFPVALGIMYSHFMMGTLNTTVGTAIRQIMQIAKTQKLPLILFIASGGARMQEGILSLLQMNTILNQWTEFENDRQLVINVLTDPTMGGVSASFGFKSDYVLAEDHAQIGFAGKRVIKQITHEELPDEFQTAEDLLTHGLIDEVVKREQMRTKLTTLLRLHSGG